MSSRVLIFYIQSDKNFGFITFGWPVYERFQFPNIFYASLAIKTTFLTFKQRAKFKRNLPNWFSEGGQFFGTRSKHTHFFPAKMTKKRREKTSKNDVVNGYAGSNFFEWVLVVFFSAGGGFLVPFQQVDIFKTGTTFTGSKKVGLRK